ncbi:MAG: Coenzyme F420 hydrogenase/dehydrogenase, beta subunit C-terminal domain [Oscillospiraceae bacterium]|nr:Coenzyme F420 hydrogenase/dehydrogenase, beta subunit C-terminal domain [Oscillospiraceae bacterium]
MTSYLISKNTEKCYGCRACEQICPRQAIVIHENDEGFLYPTLLEDKCVKCGLCTQVCPYDSPSSVNIPKRAVAAQYKDSTALLSSSSGGLFSALADYVLSRSGYVAGCVYDESFRAVHVLTNQKEMVEKMRGSKYVQSDLCNTYTRIQDLLKEGLLVLFTGTPCQVDGLHLFLGKKYDNLLTVDLICHGVPSPKLFELYLKSESEKKGKISDIKFRDKQRNGWCSQGSITYLNKTKTISPYNNSYYNFYYLQNNISRMSCYSCKYSSKERVGDLTVGDYWNITEDFPKLDISAGFSAVLINTDKGERMFAEISSQLHIYGTELDAVVRGNGNLYTPSLMPENRKNIYSRIFNEGYDSVAKKYCEYQYIRPFIRKYMPKGLKKILKKVLR